MATHWPKNMVPYILEKLEEYTIRDKVIAVTLDNATNNSVIIELMRLRFHLQI